MRLRRRSIPRGLYQRPGPSWAVRWKDINGDWEWAPLAFSDFVDAYGCLIVRLGQVEALQSFLNELDDAWRGRAECG